AAVQPVGWSGSRASSNFSWSGCGHIETGLSGAGGVAATAAHAASLGIHRRESRTDDSLRSHAISKTQARSPVLPVCLDGSSAIATYSGATVVTGELQ